MTVDGAADDSGLVVPAVLAYEVVAHDVRWPEGLHSAAAMVAAALALAALSSLAAGFAFAVLRDRDRIAQEEPA